jgi:hypothetical protein
VTVDLEDKRNWLWEIDDNSGDGNIGKGGNGNIGKGGNGNIGKGGNGNIGKGGDENEEKGGHIGPPVHMNEIGKMMDYWWGEIKCHFQNVELDEYVIMPNHMHGIIIIKWEISSNGLKQ